jgi:hypothetical protein
LTPAFAIVASQLDEENKSELEIVKDPAGEPGRKGLGESWASQD